jgi:hypothetical protein
LQGPFQFKGRAFHEQLGSLVDDLKGHLVEVAQLLRLLLQCQKLIRAQVALIVGCSPAGKDGFPQVFCFVHGAM